MISIIIPTYNRAHFLPRAIKSVINQTYKDWELIIVDDGSTDNTEEIVSEFLYDKRIKYIKKENSGAAHSRNVGVDSSKYDWITFLDSDDEALPDWIEKSIVKMKNNPRLKLYSVGCEVVNNGNIIKKLPEENKLFPGLIYKITNGGSFLLDKNIFNKVGGYDVNLKANQHTELSYRILPIIIENNYKTDYTNECLIRIHIHEGERIRNNWAAVYQGTLQMIIKHANLLKKDRKTLSNYYSVLAYSGRIIGKGKKEVFSYLVKAVKYDPFSIKKYLRFIKYIL